jgi:hypothetical protein
MGSIRMGNYKEIAQLEDSLFQTLEALYQAKYHLNKTKYKLALGTLEILNAEYNQISGKDFIDPTRILGYYQELWEIENWKKY